LNSPAGARSIHEKVVTQSLLGSEAFVERLFGRVRGRERMKEIPKRQRYIGRPSLRDVFKAAEEKQRRNRKIRDAVMRHGYSQREIADHLGMHYSTVSRIVGMSRFKT
jgi:putative transposase